jgi:hypothetical protein
LVLQIAMVSGSEGEAARPVAMREVLDTGHAVEVGSRGCMPGAAVIPGGISDDTARLL